MEMWAEANERIDSVSAEELAQELDSGAVLLLDVRLPVEIQRRGTIAGSVPVPRGVVEWWADPCITPGRLCWTRAMIEAAGGENIFADQEVRSRPVHAEEVVKGDPELILLCWAGIPFDEIDPAKARARKEWNRITAVQTNSLHPVEEGWYGRPGPRVVLGIRQMAEWIATLEDNP